MTKPTRAETSQLGVVILPWATSGFLSLLGVGLSTILMLSFAVVMGGTVGRD